MKFCPKESVDQGVYNPSDRLPGPLNFKWWSLIFSYNNLFQSVTQQYIYIYMCVCVCVCVYIYIYIYIVINIKNLTTCFGSKEPSSGQI